MQQVMHYRTVVGIQMVFGVFCVMQITLDGMCRAVNLPELAQHRLGDEAEHDQCQRAKAYPIRQVFDRIIHRLSV